MRASLVLLLLAAAVTACSDPGSAPTDAGTDAASGLCAGRPCRTSIDTAEDWAEVSRPHVGDGRCDFVEDGKFVAPAVDGDVLTDVVFQDVGVHALHLDFLTQALPELFGGMTPQQYQQVALRRAGRRLWAGAIFQLVDEGGVVIGYGFDVAVDPAWDEQLTEAEVNDVARRLRAAFHLPLVYAPVTDEAIYFARQFTSTTVHYPRACQFVRCANPSLDCVVVPESTTVCGHFMEGRPVEVEHARKTRLSVAAATVELPRTVGVHTVAAIFGAGELGPTHAAVTPRGTTATYEVVQHASFTQRIYRQPYDTAAGPVELRWEVPLPDTGGGFRFQAPYLDHHFYALLGPTEAVTQDELSQLGSCRPDSLELWRATATFTDGAATLDFRYQPPFAGSGPLFPIRGEVTLGGRTAIVDDYFRLVYAGEHHNWNNQYWILFAAPLDFRGHPVHGLWLDEAAFTSQLDGAYTLGADLRPLDTLTTTRYDVARAP